MKYAKFLSAAWIFISTYWWTVLLAWMYYYYNDKDTLGFWLLIPFVLGYATGVFFSARAIKRMHNNTVGKVLKHETYVKKEESSDN